jgi:hypothetical protein
VARRRLTSLQAYRLEVAVSNTLPRLCARCHRPIHRGQPWGPAPGQFFDPSIAPAHIAIVHKSVDGACPPA